MTLDEILPLFPPLPADAQLPCPIVVLDTETTGFPAGMKGGHPDARVIEFGAVALGVDGVPFALLELLIEPHKFPAAGLWPGIVKAGLTQELLEAEGLSAADAYKRICDWWPAPVGALAALGLPNEPTRLPWVAFNSPFDRAILAQSFMLPPGPPPLPDLTFEEVVVHGAHHDLDGRDYDRPGCVMLAAMDCLDAANTLPRWRNGNPKWPTCDEAMAFLEIDYHHPHRALPDAIGEALVAVALARRGWAPWR